MLCAFSARMSDLLCSSRPSVLLMNMLCSSIRCRVSLCRDYSSINFAADAATAVGLAKIRGARESGGWVCTCLAFLFPIGRSIAGKRTHQSFQVMLILEFFKIIFFTDLHKIGLRQGQRERNDERGRRARQGRGRGLQRS